MVSLHREFQNLIHSCKEVFLSKTGILYLKGEFLFKFGWSLEGIHTGFTLELIIKGLGAFSEYFLQKLGRVKFLT
jgi:hypothetical protein